MATTGKKRASGGNRAGMAVIGSIVCLLILVLLMQSIKLKKKIVSYQTSNASLVEQIQEEKDRTAEIEKLPEYIKSDVYIEKAAREKFGLVYEDEIIFKPEE